MSEKSGPTPDATRPVLTVVLSVRDVAPHLAACLNSILAGAPEILQVVAVDDASTDVSGRILDSYARRDARIAVLHRTDSGDQPAKDRGQAAELAGARSSRPLEGPARQAGRDRARGEYVWFVDGGDQLAPGTVEAVLARLAELRPDLLLVPHARPRRRGSDGGAPIGRFAGTVRVAERPRLLNVLPAAWNRIVHRDLLDQTFRVTSRSVT
jgi:CDP-glycerol glycerophosphotransferase